MSFEPAGLGSLLRSHQLGTLEHFQRFIEPQINPADVPIVMGDTPEEQRELEDAAAIESMREAGFGAVPQNLPIPGPLGGVRSVIRGTPLPTGPVGTILRNPVDLNEGETVPSYYEYSPGLWQCCGRIHAV